MARNTKDGAISKETTKLLNEEKETQKRQDALHQENVDSEKEKAAALAEAQNTEKTVPEEKVDEKGRKARWEAFLKAYEAANPTKYAAKKERGEFKEIPASFN